MPLRRLITVITGIIIIFCHRRLLLLQLVAPLFCLVQDIHVQSCKPLIGNFRKRSDVYVAPADRATKSIVHRLHIGTDATSFFLPLSLVRRHETSVADNQRHTNNATNERDFFHSIRPLPLVRQRSRQKSKRKCTLAVAREQRQRNSNSGSIHFFIFIATTAAATYNSVASGHLRPRRRPTLIPLPHPFPANGQLKFSATFIMIVSGNQSPVASQF